MGYILINGKWTPNKTQSQKVEGKGKSIEIDLSSTIKALFQERSSSQFWGTSKLMEGMMTVLQRMENKMNMMSTKMVIMEKKMIRLGKDVGELKILHGILEKEEEEENKEEQKNEEDEKEGEDEDEKEGGDEDEKEEENENDEEGGNGTEEDEGEEGNEEKEEDDEDEKEGGEEDEKEEENEDDEEEGNGTEEDEREEGNEEEEEKEKEEVDSDTSATAKEHRTKHKNDLEKTNATWGGNEKGNGIEELKEETDEYEDFWAIKSLKKTSQSLTREVLKFRKGRGLRPRKAKFTIGVVPYTFTTYLSSAPAPPAPQIP